MKKNFSGSRKFFLFPLEWKKKINGAFRPFKKEKTFWSPESFFIVISVSALWWHAAAEQALRGPEGTQAAGRAGHPRNKRPWRAPKQPAPQGIQAAGPAGHPRNKRSRRAPKEQRGTAAPTVPKDSGPGRHPRNKWSWEQAACGPGKLSRLETAPIPKKNFPTPDFFFCSVLGNLLLWQLRCLLQIHSAGHLSKASRGKLFRHAKTCTRWLSLGSFVLGDTGYRTRQTGAFVNLRRDHIAGHPGCLNLLPLAQTFLRSRFWSRGLCRPLFTVTPQHWQENRLCVQKGISHTI